MIFIRGVAQPGSVLAWGARGREFKSHRPDQFIFIFTLKIFQKFSRLKLTQRHKIDKVWVNE